MKRNRWFILFIVAFLAVMFAVECNLPKKFVWTPTFSRYDTQPFGCAVFDSLLSVSLPGSYTLSKKTFYQLEREDTLCRRGILAVAYDIFLSELDVKSLLKMAERGNKIMLVSTTFSRYLKDTLNFESYRYYFSPMSLKKYAVSLSAKDSICWVGPRDIYPRQTFYFYPHLCSSYFRVDSLAGEVLSQKVLHADEYRHDTGTDSISSETRKVMADSLEIGTDTVCYCPVAITYPVGKGEVILVSTPLIFTNYGMLDEGNSTYIFRLLSQMGELPVVRTEGYTGETAEVRQSPFRYLLSRQPLRWALYLTMAGILLFMITSARRRQRAIPVIREPANKSIEFIELIGTLYYQKGEHADLVRKKFIYFAEELRREIQVDVEEAADDERSFHKIARKTGMDAEEIAKLIREVRPVVYGGRTVDADRMKMLVDKMNEITNHI